MSRTILVGGGGFARELFFWSEACIARGDLAPLAGYLDDRGDVLAPFGYALPYLGTVDGYMPRPGDGVLLAIGSPLGKRAIHERLKDRGAAFPRMIHPTVRRVATARLDEGVIMCPGGTAGPDTYIDRFVTINIDSGLGHDARVGEFSTLSARVDVTGGVKVGADVLIGSGASLMPSIRIGDGATIGAAAICYRSVPAGATVFAQPSKTIRRKSPAKRN